MNQPWSDLPNAHHIDWVIESLKDDRSLWDAAPWGAASGAAWDAARDAAMEAARLAAWDAARDAAMEAARLAARDAAWDVAWAAHGRALAARGAARTAARTAASGAALALIAYDDCDEYLKMSYEELRIWAALSEHPAAVLLLSMVYVREKSH